MAEQRKKPAHGQAQEDLIHQHVGLAQVEAG